MENPKQQLTLNNLQNFIESNPDIKKVWDSLLPMMTYENKRFDAAKQEAEVLFSNLCEATFDEAVTYCEAHPPSPAAIAILIHVAHKELRLEQVKKGAAAKLKRDPVQTAKREAKKLWQERRIGQHRKLRTNEQFAMEAMRRWPALTSSKVICGWCTAWEKEAKSKETPVS